MISKDQYERQIPKQQRIKGVTALAKSLKTLTSFPDPNLNNKNCVTRQNPFKKPLELSQEFLTSTSIIRHNDSVGSSEHNQDIFNTKKRGKGGIFNQKSPIKGLTKKGYSPKADDNSDYFEDMNSDRKVIRDVQLEISSSQNQQLISTHFKARDSKEPIATREAQERDKYFDIPTSPAGETSDANALQSKLDIAQGGGSLLGDSGRLDDQSAHKVHIEITKQPKKAGKTNQQVEMVDLGSGREKQSPNRGDY